MEPEPDPYARLADLASELVDEVVAALPDWVSRCITDRQFAVTGVSEDDVVSAGRRAADEVGQRLRTLMTADVDEQWTGPLAILRDATRYPTELLAAAGVPPVDRDADAQQMFPDDLYDLTPASFADIHPDLQGPGLAWGAAKAYVHGLRHRRDER
jgi:hypothetical protein|tara:strand:- start:300 stop:767 length:468 start_codon:yes stop_codon:yes gene_type:complete